MKGVIYGLLLSHLLVTSWAARILVLSPLGPKSHMNLFMPLVEVLAERGHQLTVVTNHLPKSNSSNIHSIVLTELVPFIDVKWYDFKKHGLLASTMGIFHFLRTSMSVAYEHFIKNQEIQKIKNSKNVYDLAIVDGIVNDFALPLVDHLNIPFIFFDPGPGINWNLDLKSVALEYASIPPMFGDLGNPMNFFQRMTNFVVNEAFLVIRRHFLLLAVDRLAIKDFPNGRPISEIEKDAELVFANIDPVTSWLRSYPPSFIPVRALHVRPAQPISEDLERFASEAEHGFIVFTLGSNSQVSSMPQKTKDMFVRTFGRLQQRVIWKWEQESFPELPSNVKLVDWLPQQDLLGHKNARLFITHGGLMGMQETLYHQVPILGLPLGRDQRVLLIKASEEGYGIKLEWEDLTEDLLFESIQKILNEPSYKENVARLCRVMRDEQVPSRETAAYWVEYVLRHGGAKHLQTKAQHTPFYQLYLLDVWLFMFVAFSVSLFLTWKVITFVGRRMLVGKVKTQ